MNYNELITRLIANAGSGVSEKDIALRDAATAIDVLTAELSEERHRHDRLQDFEVAQAQALERVKAERDALKNELCYKCGNYKQAHNGWCDSCRWKR